jgi:hypothetical protein
MALATGEHTILEFIRVQCLGDWARWSGTQMIGYTPHKDGQVVVVTQDNQGAKTTYWFKVRSGKDVWVQEYLSIIHVPAICSKSASGDKAGCRD